MKKLFLVLIFAMMLIFESLSFTYADAKIKIIEDTNVSEIQNNIFQSIPVFISTVNDNEVYEGEELKTEISNKIGKSIKNSERLTLKNRKHIHLYDAKFEVAELTDIEKACVLSFTPFERTFQEARRLVENGVMVESINFFLKDNMFKGSSNYSSSDINNPAYWESNYNYLGTYNGYKFLYIEGSIAISTTPATPGNVNASFEWGTLLQKTVKNVAVMVVDSVSKGLNVFTDTISNVVGSIATPYSVNYGSASESYIKTHVSGDLYIRTVLIRDLDNRVNGYAYYEWGSTNQTRLFQIIEAKYPVSRRTSTTYNYNVISKSSGVKKANTPGFFGNQVFFAKVYDRYKNPYGYFPYNETLDVNSIVATIVNSY